MTRRLAIGLVVALALALPSAAHAAGRTQELAVQDIDTSDYPKVALTVSMPGSAGSTPRFTIAENGAQIRGVDADVAAKSIPVRVVLVLDTSGSMAGEPWADARAAAARFLDTLGPETPVSVVAFNERATRLTDFSTDREAALAALSAQQPAKETALYDAVVSASRIAASAPGERSVIVLLSDGGDTVSASSFKGAMSALEKSGVPLYAIMLPSPESNERALALLSGSSGGRLTSAKRSAELGDLFQSIAEEIVGTYKVTYTSLRPKTKDIELDIVARARASSAEAKLSYPNPLYLSAAEQGPLVVPSPAESLARLLAAGGLAFVCAFCVGLAIMRSVFHERSVLSQVRLYDQEERRGRWRGSLGALSGLRRRWVRVVERTLESRGWAPRVAPAFETAGLPLAPAEYIAYYIGAVAAGVLLLQLLLNSWPLTIIAAGASTLLPKVLLGAAADRRKRAFETQLPDVLAMLSTSMRGGWTLERAIELAATEAADPAAKEFGRVVAEMELGLSCPTALEHMAARVKSPDFDAAVGGITVQREIGGNLAEVLDTVAETVREREALRRQIRTLTAEARLSAYILIGLPFALLALMLLTSPTYIGALFTTTSGWMIVATAALMLSVGSFWLFRLTKIEV